MQVKIIFKNDTKKTKLPANYEALIAYVLKTDWVLPQKYRFYYQDEDADVCSISNQDDMEGALDSFKNS